MRMAVGLSPKGHSGSQSTHYITHKLDELININTIGLCLAVDPHGQVKVALLPPNCTSVFHPMDCGVIAMVKKNSRCKLLHKMIDILDQRQVLRENAKKAKMASGTTGLSEVFAHHLRDVMDILYNIWNAIKPEQIRHCWRKSTLIDHNHPSSNIDNETVATSDTAAETVTTDQSNNQHDCNVEDMFAEVDAFVERHDCKSRGDDEFDEIVWEMTLAVQECKINTQAKNKLVEGWISMEDNQQCNNLLA